MATSPAFAATPFLKTAALSAANTNRDGTGTLVDVVTGSTNGSRIERVTITATATTTTGVLRLWAYDGTSNVLYRELLVTAITPSTSVATFTTQLSGLALVLPSGAKLKATTHNAETFVVVAEGADL